jgi:CheY-like chemotaxis protein
MTSFQKACRPRVLIVDDEEYVGEALGRSLRQKYSSTSVTSGRDALAVLATTRVDIILCDITMPEMTGEDFYAEVAALFPEALSKIVFMAASILSDGVIPFLSSVPNPLLEKPFTHVDLECAFEQVMRKAA